MKSKAMQRAHYRAKQCPRPRYRRLGSAQFVCSVAAGSTLFSANGRVWVAHPDHAPYALTVAQP